MYAGAHTLRIHVSNGCGIAGVPGSRTSHAPGARASCALSVQTRSRFAVRVQEASAVTGWLLCCNAPCAHARQQYR